MRRADGGDARGSPRSNDWAVARKENEPGNRRGEPRMSLEDEPITTAKASFEELLARELEKADNYAPRSDGWTSMSGRTTASASSSRSASTAGSKKTFLKKGARGWWMQRPDAKNKMQKHTLVSKDEGEVTAPARTRSERKTATSVRRKPAIQKSTPLPPPPPPPTPLRRSESLDRSPTTVSSPIAPIKQPSKYERRESIQESDTPSPPTDWKDASFASNATLGMTRVRLSYEAKREREADELAEFEAIERELAAERDDYLLEREEAEEHKRSGSAHVSHSYSHGQSGQWHTRQYSLPAPTGLLTSRSAPDSPEVRDESNGAASPPEDRLDLGARSDFIFNGRQSSELRHSSDEWQRYSTDGSIDFDHRISDSMFGRGNRAPSELSAISFDDSVPWDDGLTLQRQDLAGNSPRDHRGDDTATSLLGEAHAPVSGSTSNDYGSFDAPPKSAFQSQRINRSRDRVNDYEFETVHEDLEHSDEFVEDGGDQAPVSSLVQQVFGDIRSDDDSFSIESHYEEMFDPEDAVDQDRGQTGGTDASRQDFSKTELSTLKRKMNSKSQATTAPADRRGAESSAVALKGVQRRRGIPPHSSASKPRAAARGSKRSTSSSLSNPSGTTGPIFPTVIEEKLYELEEEVKFYKAETLQLQKRKEHYEQETKKLQREREDFSRYQQEQRALMEKEWQQERAKMKKEAQLMDRQWKLRMNATSSTQDRKAKSEIEILKAQIVKMQVDETARMTKWKNSNENLRQRIAELEVKNHELSEQIRFLESDRLAQWEKFERQLKEKQDQFERLVSTNGFGGTENPFERDDPIRTTEDLFSVRNAADELLTSWSRDRDPGEGDASAQGPGKSQPSPSSSSRVENAARLARGASPSPSSGHRRAHSTTDGYNPKRYSLEKAASEPSGSMANLNSEIQAHNGKKELVTSTRSEGGRGTFEGLHGSHPTDGTFGAADPVGYTIHKGLDRGNEASDQGRPPCSLQRSPSSTSQTSATKQITREISHAGGKKEVEFTDGSKRIIFPDGNEKEIDASGHTVIKFTNGDRKEVFPDTGISVYYYHDAQTKLTTYPDQTKVYEFPNQQVEKSFPDGSTEIVFADGIRKTIRVNGDEFSVFPDGTTMLERKDGTREVALLNGKTIRYYSDGRMASVGVSGEEVEIRSDTELRRLMER